MNRFARLLALCTVLLGTAAFAAAQSNLSVDVPFAFQVGDRVLPAGTYSVTRVFEGDPTMLALTGVHTKHRVNVYASPASGRAGASLFFLHSGETYSLTGLSTPAGKFSIANSAKQRLMAFTPGEVEISGSK